MHLRGILARLLVKMLVNSSKNRAMNSRMHQTKQSNTLADWMRRILRIPSL